MKCAALMTLCGLLLTGCGTFGKNNVVTRVKQSNGRVVEYAEMSVSRNGLVKVGDRICDYRELGSVLKSLGVGYGVHLKVQVPLNDNMYMRMLKSSLARAGYRLVTFTTPRKASAYISPPKKHSGLRRR